MKKLMILLFIVVLAFSFATTSNAAEFAEKIVLNGESFSMYYDPGITEMFFTEEGDFAIDNKQSVMTDTYSSAYVNSDFFTLEKGLYMLTAKVKAPEEHSTSGKNFAYLQILDNEKKYVEYNTMLYKSSLNP